ncbi:MAG TPA: transporter [Polyangia bacterium]|jgi:hypothetical protein
MWARPCLLAVLLIAAGRPAAALPPACDTERWTLLHPMPAWCLEPIDTDRPHRTDTPHTVAPGHLQVETGVVAYEAPRDGTSPRVHTLRLLETLVKIGLHRRIDAQVGYTAVTVRHQAAGPDDVAAPESLYLRLKLNLIGPGAPFSVTVAPVLNVPLDGRTVEGGGTLMVGAELPGRLELEVNGSAFRQQREAGRRWVFVPSAAVTRALVGRLAAFVELYGEAYDGGGARTGATFDTGLLYWVSRDTMLDAGVYVGLTKNVPPATVFLGLSTRI